MVASVASRRVFCSSCLQTCSSTVTAELTGRLPDSSTDGGLGGELQDASRASVSMTGVSRTVACMAGLLQEQVSSNSGRGPIADRRRAATGWTSGRLLP